MNRSVKRQWFTGTTVGMTKDPYLGFEFSLQLCWSCRIHVVGRSSWDFSCARPIGQRMRTETLFSSPWGTLWEGYLHFCGSWEIDYFFGANMAWLCLYFMIVLQILARLHGGFYNRPGGHWRIVFCLCWLPFRWWRIFVWSVGLSPFFG